MKNKMENKGLPEKHEEEMTTQEELVEFIKNEEEKNRHKIEKRLCGITVVRCLVFLAKKIDEIKSKSCYDRKND